MLVFIALFPADEAFVDFDDAAQLVKVIARAARLAETLQHEPSGLLGNANLFAELQAGDAFPCGYEQVHGVEPLVQGNVAALEDRACTDGEIEGTGIAAVEANLRLFADALYGSCTQGRTGHRARGGIPSRAAPTQGSGTSRKVGRC